MEIDTNDVPLAILSNEGLRERNGLATMEDYLLLGREHGLKAAKAAVETQAWKDPQAFWHAHINIVMPEQIAKLRAAGGTREQVWAYTDEVTRSMNLYLKAAGTSAVEVTHR